MPDEECPGKREPVENFLQTLGEHEALALLGKTNCTNLAHASVGHAQRAQGVAKGFVSEPC